MTVRVLVTGGRGYPNRKAVQRMLAYIATLFPEADAGDFVLVHGDCKYRDKNGDIDYDRSADQLAAQEAGRLGWGVEGHPVGRDDYARLGRYQAPRQRNIDIIESGVDICAAFPGGGGTKHCRTAAEAAGIRVVTMAMVDR